MSQDRAKTFKIWASEPLSRGRAIEPWSDQAKSRSIIKQRSESSHRASKLRSEPKSKLFGLCSRLSFLEAKLKLLSSYTLSLRGNVKDKSINQRIHMWFSSKEKNEKFMHSHKHKHKERETLTKIYYMIWLFWLLRDY